MEKDQEINKWLIGNPSSIIKLFKACNSILKGVYSGKVVE